MFKVAHAYFFMVSTMLFSAPLAAQPLSQWQHNTRPEMRVTLTDATLTPAPMGLSSTFSGIIKNPADAPLTIQEITSPVAQSVVIRRYQTNSVGLTEATVQPQLFLAPGAEVIFIPNQLDIAFINLNQPLLADTEVPATLHFSTGFQRTIRIAVKPNYTDAFTNEAR